MINVKASSTFYGGPPWRVVVVVEDGRALELGDEMMVVVVQVVALEGGGCRQTRLRAYRGPARVYHQNTIPHGNLLSRALACSC